MPIITLLAGLRLLQLFLWDEFYQLLSALLEQKERQLSDISYSPNSFCNM